MPAHALVAEDDPTVRAVVASFLASGGFDVTPTSDGVEALAALTDPVGRAFAVAVVDCLMPDLCGPAVVSRARAAGCRVPVLLVSASADPDEIAGLDADPLTAFLPKPFSRPELLLAVERLLAFRGTPLASAD